MTTTPAEITIYNEIEARAGNILQGNGYHTDVQKIERSRLTPFSGADWPKLSFWPMANRQNADEYDMEEHVLPIIIGYFDKTSDEPFANLAAKLKADVICALNRATTYNSGDGTGPKVGHEPSHDLGGLVLGLTVTNSDFVIKEGQAPWCGVLVEIEIKYKSETGDPFTVLAD